MKSKTIWVDTIVKNEGRFIWFALMSVIDYVDKIIVWDTGSSDSTVEIIKEIQKNKKGKIEFKELGSVSEDGFSKARQKMLDETKSDWVFILDGDEVWSKDSIEKIIKTINQKGDYLDLIVTPYYSIVGDIYHHQEEKAGKYNLAGKKGHLNIRAINRKIPGLHVDKPYGEEGFFDQTNARIQDRNPKGIIFLDTPYFHFSNIIRSDNIEGDRSVMQRSRKIRHEIGIRFSKDFIYPEVFYIDRPGIVPSPWVEMSKKYRVRSLLESPLRQIKRRLV